MNCPHCHATVSETDTTCPSCGAELSAPVRAHHEFVFCEGCGARLSSRDRTCPKCGRPAPGILSEHASASDLAAGKTASFPRLSVEAHQTEDVRERRSAAEVLESSLDPEATNMLDLSEIEQRDQHDEKRSKKAPEDPYHTRRRVSGKLITAVAVVAIIAAGAGFIVYDPLGVMPGFYASVEQAAADMFPSRTGKRESLEDLLAAGASEGDGDEATQDGASQDEPTEIEDEHVLSEDEAYETLTAIYEEIGAYQDTISDVIDDYNGYYIARDRDRREEAAESAYAMRDAVQATIDTIDGLRLHEDSAYLGDVEHMRSLATWMFGRVDVLCRSWDISLGLPEGESPSNHTSEIAQPLRDALDESGRNRDLVQFEENYARWRPAQHDA